MSSFRRMVSAFVFLAASPRRLRRCRAGRFERLAGATMLVGLLWGLVLVGLWALAFWLSWTWRHYLSWTIPACACAAAIVAGPYRQAALALIKTALGRRPLQRRIVSAAFTAGLSEIGELIASVWKPAWASRLLGRWAGLKQWRQLGGLATMTIGLAVMLNYSFRLSEADWPTRLGPGWASLWPRAMYRVLVLAPLWGSWAMRALGQVHRPVQTGDRASRHFAGSIGPVAAAAYLLAPLAGSLICLTFLSPWHFVPAGSAMLGALGGGTAMVHLAGRPCRRVLLATNLLTQLCFLIGYLSVR